LTPSARRMTIIGMPLVAVTFEGPVGLVSKLEVRQ
jgi:hypothetical protein